jgi:hypothetical protein
MVFELSYFYHVFEMIFNINILEWGYLSFCGVSITLTYGIGQPGNTIYKNKQKEFY